MNRSHSANHADFAVAGGLHSADRPRFDHAEDLERVFLLQELECDGRRRVAGGDDDLDFLLNKEIGVLPRKLRDDLFGAGAVWRPADVTEIDYILGGQ